MAGLWLDRTLIAAPYLALCVNERQFRAVLADLDVQETVPFLGSKHANATTHFFTNQEGKLVCVVTMGSTEGRTGPQVAAMLVHEAVHVWQEVRDSIGEKSPSSEFEAYSIQAISQRLMEQYAKQVK